MLESIVGVIGSFIAGIISMPFLTEGYVLLQRYRLQRIYSERSDIMKGEHLSQMHHLTEKHNAMVEDYNKKLLKIKMKLRKQDLFVDIDEDGNEILVKRMPVKVSFVERIRQRGWY